jgi:hypothetical protein
LRSGEEHQVDPIEGIVLPSPMADGLVLDAPAHGVDVAVGGCHDVEGIGHLASVVDIGA